MFDAATRTLGEASVSIGPVLAVTIAYFSRRRAVGGWLLCYYVQLYLAIAVTTWLLTKSYPLLAPSNWESATRYVMFLLSVFPLQISRVFELFAATALLMQRNAERLNLLRWALIAMLVTSAVAVGIDYFYFPVPNKLVPDGIALVSSLCWLIYFVRSRRVRFVFVEGHWDYSAYKPVRVLTAEDKKYLAKRAGLVFFVTFVVFLLMMGLALGDKKPDARIFFVPIFYALIAGLVAWYLPIRKRKSDAAVNATADEARALGEMRHTMPPPRMPIS